ncbi:unnamed protein product [Rotaria magnacalcarata]|uniref:N-acetyltransferase domain-containing protein n=1 Tax=Rotaria magnacalcarata TaxID=392030 RepID=A0A816UUN0_9BILA|nr:unnamed protein product [Rotaria magnacalcarata]CAF1490905.1 unnamed protein product [Rotaria magnacalcarata]CAF2039700.1 unnamed protein product [Rotaria magnacalcarata]CAF2116506.1 unnamed protein product [Rotaria magnacalcarata]CAF3959712.1 unnamed protein product [Rotaria magnacalcarata]
MDQSFQPLTYRLAINSDYESISQLVNDAYRGESSHQGWTNEDEFFESQRINPDILTQMMATDGSVVLIFFEQDSKILIGCVSLQDSTMAENIRIGCCIPLQQDNKVKSAYLGMLTVRPDLQRRGYGKFIVSVAEKFVRQQWNTQLIELSVLSNRQELIAYYIRRGYTDTGRRQQFSSHDNRFGIPKIDCLEYCILTKFI